MKNTRTEENIKRELDTVRMLTVVATRQGDFMNVAKLNVRAQRLITELAELMPDAGIPILFKRES